MENLLVIKIKDATPEQIEEQFKIRAERIQSNDVFNLAAQFLSEGINTPISIEVLCEKYSKAAHNMGATIRQLRTAHGLEIKNVAPQGTKGMYQLIGFCERDYRRHVATPKPRKRKSKMFTKPETYNPLITQVFC